MYSSTMSSFLGTGWIVRIVHVYRKTNHLVDELANYAFTLPLDFQYLDNISNIVESLVSNDDRRPAYSRQFRV